MARASRSRAASSRTPRTSRYNPALETPRFTHVSGRNGALIPVGKATREEIATGLEEYLSSHGQYPNNYPGGPQDLSDSEDDLLDSEDDLLEVGVRETPDL